VNKQEFQENLSGDGVRNCSAPRKVPWVGTCFQDRLYGEPQKQFRISLNLHTIQHADFTELRVGGGERERERKRERQREREIIMTKVCTLHQGSHLALYILWVVSNV
jgi:hypothetical protein